MLLGFCRRPYEDELFFGYIQDIFYKNGFVTMKAIHNFFGCGYVRIYGSTGLAVMCDLIENQTFPSISEAIAMTPYYAMVQDMTEGEQAKYAEQMMFPESITALQSKATLKENIKICKKCLQEDKQTYSSAYLHLSHHLPGVEICTKHGKVLESINFKEFKSKFREIHPIEDFQSVPIVCKDKKQAMMIALDAEIAYQQNQGILENVKCAVCGKVYMEHRYSRETKAGCPFCNEKRLPYDILTQRLLSRFPDGEYEIEPEFKSFCDVVVTHRRCGTGKKRLGSLLYKNATNCSECKNLTAKSLQRRFDTDKKHWLFAETVTDVLKKDKRIYVMHLDCGNKFEFFMTDFTSRKDGYCPYCDNNMQPMEINDLEYQMIGDYQNNRELVNVKHSACGLVYKTNKTAFLAGKKCPICSWSRLDVKAVEQAIKACLPDDYEMNKSKCYGYVDIKRKDGTVIENMAYETLIEDLMSDKPIMIPDRVKKYEYKQSIRRRIYDSIKEFTQKNGYWCFVDGIDGMKIDAGTKRILQDMENHGFIQRMEIGKYKVKDGDEI